MIESDSNAGPGRSDRHSSSSSDAASDNASSADADRLDYPTGCLPGLFITITPGTVIFGVILVIVLIAVALGLLGDLIGLVFDR